MCAKNCLRTSAYFGFGAELFQAEELQYFNYSVSLWLKMFLTEGDIFEVGDYSGSHYLVFHC